MTLRVSHLVAALVFLSLGNSHIGVNAATCTADEEATTKANYESIVKGVDSVCRSDTCAYSCEDQLSSSVAALPDCTSSDGTNYHQTLAADYACAKSSTGTVESPTANMDNVCSEDNEIKTGNIIAKAELGDCGANDPCEASCLTKLRQLVNELPDCSDTNGDNYYQYYLSLTSTCTTTGSSTTETTPAPSSDSPATTTAAPSVTTATPTTTTSAPSTGSTSPSEAAAEEETTETTETTETSSASEEASSASAEASSSVSAAGSASASQGNDAMSVGGSTIGSLVVAGTLALLAAQA